MRRLPCSLASPAVSFILIYPLQNLLPSPTARHPPVQLAIQPRLLRAPSRGLGLVSRIPGYYSTLLCAALNLGSLTSRSRGVYTVVWWNAPLDRARAPHQPDASLTCSQPVQLGPFGFTGAILIEVVAVLSLFSSLTTFARQFLFVSLSRFLSASFKFF